VVTKRTVLVTGSKPEDVADVGTFELQLTPLYRFLGNLQTGSVSYLLLMGFATLLFNF
jgi:hypothetical protein